MTDKENLEKIKSLADKMYYAAFNMTTDASLLRRAMDKYHLFIIHEYHKEESVSEKKCMFINDSYTDEDRKVLCEDCDEKCEYNKKEEPVNEEFEEALAREWQGYNDRGAATIDALEDNTQELAFAKGFYRGAKWQKEQMMAKAIDAHCFGFQGAALFSFRLPADNYLVGSEVKVIVIKED